MLLLLTLFLLAVGCSIVSAYLDIYISGFPNRIYSNVSLGLEWDLSRYGHQCAPGIGKKRSCGAFGDEMSMVR